MKKNGGVALVELLTVVSIMAILFTIGTLSLGNIERENYLDLTASEIKNAIYQTQAQTVNGVDSGVYFSNNRFVIFQGESFLEGDPNNQQTTLSPGLEITNINLFLQTISFLTPSGYVENYSTPANLTLTETITQKTRLIIVNNLGMVEIN